jgi:hypothetical protein
MYLLGDITVDIKENPAENKKVNPLAQWYRQPKIYVRLPSKGQFYPHGSLDTSETGDYPVYSMTAKDELMFKTPDALLNGQSTVEVIKSCFPAIQNPWQMPSLDVDAALIAIRIATYGEKMEVGTTCPHCTAENSYDVDLTNWLARLNQFNYESEIVVDPLVIHVRPFSYLEMTKNSIKTLEHQKIFSIINDETISEEDKIAKFGQSFVKLTELTVDLVASCVSRVDTPNGSSSDPAEILEFIHNAPKEIFDRIASHVTYLKEKIDLPPQSVQCNDCSKEFVMPVSMDQSNFFAVRS